MNSHRNISGTFNHRLGLGTTRVQHQAGVGSWDTATSAQTKVAVQSIKLFGQVEAQPVIEEKSSLYDIAFKLGQIFK